ncbi:hypothetical protein O6H91_01G159700 [Diphasiastrum complanatum]|uniref:Uncharacterized protein n=1 Tax=Diphasiastrum complanatum TaxID=34168 RepID=A0ACC2EXT8_DIPCM|nr:hypothetical protein O6H91_01G159700 [Diphasiastrum complanatum]
MICPCKRFPLILIRLCCKTFYNFVFFDIIIFLCAMWLLIIQRLWGSSVIAVKKSSLMGDLDDDGDEEWFQEIYGKVYTGPTKPFHEKFPNGQSPKETSKSDPMASATEQVPEEQVRDPNAVPTDFTSREAKFWEAKTKAMEKNWKRKKEVELVCYICGQIGHFPQGCPTTLGANKKSSEVVERITVKDKRLKRRIIGTGGSLIRGIEKDTGCRLQLENMKSGNGALIIRVSGSERKRVLKALRLVKRLVDEAENEWKYSNMRGPKGYYNRSYEESDHVQHIEGQRVQCITNADFFSNEPFPGEDYAFEQTALELEAGQTRQAGSCQSLNGCGTLISSAFNKGARRFSSLFDGKSPNADSIMVKGYRHGILQELEGTFILEVNKLARDQNAEEDQENARHHECMKGIQDQYKQKMATLTYQQTRQRERFLHRQEELQSQQKIGYRLVSSTTTLPMGRCMKSNASK